MATAVLSDSGFFFHKERVLNLPRPVKPAKEEKEVVTDDRPASEDCEVASSVEDCVDLDSPLTFDASKQYEITREHTYFIIDWDDTLLATSWLARNRISLDTVFIPQKESSELEALDAAVCSLLRKIIYLYGKVLIVTNAQQQWVELSSRKFLPEASELIFSPSSASCCSFSSSSSACQHDLGENEQTASFSIDYLERVREPDSEKLQVPSVRLRNGKKRARLSTPMEIENKLDVAADESGENISVFSARYMFENDFPNDPSAWKRKAFQKLLQARISSNFFIVQPTAPVKSHSADMLLDLDEKTSQASRYSGSSLERRNSSLSGIDLADLVELEGESFEIETEFHENDSFFSFDFRPAPEDEYDYASLMGEHNNSPNSAQEPPVLNEKSTACNLISIGDCFHDCESLKDLDLDLKDTFKKTVKLIEFPEIAQVIKQVKELEMHLDMIVKAKRDLDLVVDKSHL